MSLNKSGGGVNFHEKHQKTPKKWPKIQSIEKMGWPIILIDFKSYQEFYSATFDIFS